MYNTARVLEQPIAPFEFVEANQQGGSRTADGSENEDLDTTRESFEFVEVNEQSGAGSNAVSTEHGDTESTESEELDTTFFDSNAQDGSSQLDVKPVIEDDDALSAYGHLFNVRMRLSRSLITIHRLQMGSKSKAREFLARSVTIRATK